ncbi:hypothetical protein TWF703_005817 [Orbilia oligospora]|uniref:Major facilitator superfamily (MFS) profile domain-containing protein n=1 Tax=Orbilia oligospora TaxID=2813651 RepID=A0A7C8NTL7_ORBOL|nr:hypothetical protein TWF703_005817 [Orbilia oligospora]
MSSLASLPQELVDMILSTLTLQEINKLRLLSKSHDARFKHLYRSQAFGELRLTLQAAQLQNLFNLLKGAGDELKQYFRHITIRLVESYNEVKDPKVKPLLTGIFKKMDYLETVEFDITFRSSNVIDHWKPVMDAIIAAKRHSIEVIKSPRCGLAMSTFNLREPQLISYENTFKNLRSLEVSTSVQSERPDVTFAFWSWVNVIGSNLEELAVAGFRSKTPTRPKPDAEGRFLPKNFDLPKLKSLELVHVCLTLKDMKTMLRNTDVIEELNIVGCVTETNRPSYFFKLLKYLQNKRATRLQSLDLALSGLHDSIVAYELPNITFSGNWMDPETLTLVELNQGKVVYRGAVAYSLKKSLWKELETHNTTIDFWHSITDGKWVDREVTRWKKFSWASGFRVRRNENYHLHICPTMHINAEAPRAGNNDTLWNDIRKHYSREAETFLYGFIVPILPEILQDRNNVPPGDIQRVTYQLLTIYGAIAMVSSMLIGELADRASSRQTPLIIALAVAFVGTLTLALSTKLWGVFLGRIIQGVGGTAAWIVGFATLRDSIHGSNMGKAAGLIQGFVSVGALSGPAVAGLLLELTGYWITWGSALLLLVVDIVMRLLMIEQRKVKTNLSSPQEPAPEETNENSALIPGASTQSYDSVKDNEPPAAQSKISTLSFYKIIFSQRRVLTALLCSTTYSAMLASFSTTIPTHVKFAFGWGSLPTGLLFVGLEGPTIIAGPLCGWFRDKVGTKAPATIGYLSLAPLLWLLGAADQQQFPWAKDEQSAQATYIATVITIGFITNLLSSVGTLELTAVVDALEAKQPGIFGPNGGYSRTYSLSGLSFSTGLVVGPLLSGTLTESIGYYRMNMVLATVSVTVGIIAFSFLGGKSSLEIYNLEREEAIEE